MTRGSVNDRDSIPSPPLRESYSSSSSSAALLLSLCASAYASFRLAPCSATARLAASEGLAPSASIAPIEAYSPARPDRAAPDRIPDAASAADAAPKAPDPAARRDDSETPSITRVISPRAPPSREANSEAADSSVPRQNSSWTCFARGETSV